MHPPGVNPLELQTYLGFLSLLVLHLFVCTVSPGYLL
jgi:hypothetical protein